MTTRNSHMMTVFNLGRLLGTFVQARGLGAIGVEQALTAFTRNDYALRTFVSGETPKAKRRSREWDGGGLSRAGFHRRSAFSQHGSTHDRGVKFEDYAARIKMGEYWIIDPEAKVIEQYVHRQGGYDLAGKILRRGYAAPLPFKDWRCR